MSGFNNFLGNEQVVSSIKNLIAENRLPHAVVIEGEEGIGKKTLADIIASALVCKSPQKGEPCSECSACKKVKTGHPDIIHIEGDKKRVAIGVEFIRSLRLDAFEKPVEFSKKVYIITRRMNESAQNALLKVLEEPPSFTYIIVLTESKNHLLETVLSRSVVFSLTGVPVEKGMEYILSQKPKWERETVEKVLHNSRGNIGRAVKLLSSKSKTESADIASGMLTSLAEGNRGDFLVTVNPIAEKQKRDLCSDVLETASLIVRDATVKKLLPDGVCVSGEGETAQLLSRRTDKETLMKYFEILNDYISRTDYSPNLRLFVTALCADLFAVR